MEKYDENLAENKFLLSLKTEYEDLFKESILNNYLICVPKSSVIQDISADIILDHILAFVNESECTSTQDFITKNGNELQLHKGKFKLKENSDKAITIPVLFEETFYDKKYGKYGVVCINNYITNLLNNEAEPDNDAFNNILMNDMRSVSDFENYICKVTKNSLVIDQIDEYIKEFLSLPSFLANQPSQTHSLSIQVYKLFNSCIDEIHSLVSALSYSELSNLHISVESYIVHNLYNVLFKASVSDTATDDEKINRIIHSIKDFQVPDFRLKTCNINWLKDAKCELAAINNFKSSFSKLQCINRAIECFQTKNVLSSDELLPILAYCIVKGSISNWFANLSFIKHYSFSLKSNSKYSFILSSFEAALIFIYSGEITNYGFANLNPDQKPKSSVLFESEGELGAFLVSQEPSDVISKSLYKIIQDDNLDQLKSFLEAPSTLNMDLPEISSRQLCHPLCNCTKCKDIIKDFVEQSSALHNIHSRDDNSMTLLHIAAWFGSMNITEYLLLKGSNYNAQNLVGMTPLHLASYRGHQTTLLLLIHYGSDINKADNEGNTALHLACKAGHDNCVKALIFYSESVGNQIGLQIQNMYGDTPLHLAAHWGYLSIVQFLVNQPCVLAECLDLKNIHNQTPQQCSHNEKIASVFRNIDKAENLHTNLVLLNLDSNTEKSKLDTSKDTAVVKSEIPDSNVNIILRKVMNAIYAKDTKLACFLLEIDDEVLNSNLNENNNKCHPLCQCTHCSNIYSPTSLVKSNNSLINMVGKENFGILHSAVLNDNLELCHILLLNGANPQILTQIEKQSCLHLSVVKENSKLMKLLIAFNADINATDIFGNTPLHLSSARGWKEGVVLLCEFGAKLNINNKEDLTPKEVAEANGHVEIVEILIRKLSF